jgi:hypothetical protein
VILKIFVLFWSDDDKGHIEQFDTEALFCFEKYILSISMMGCHQKAGRAFHNMFSGARPKRIKKKKNITHTYTLWPILLADGHLLDKFFLILQEWKMKSVKE